MYRVVKHRETIYFRSTYFEKPSYEKIFVDSVSSFVRFVLPIYGREALVKYFFPPGVKVSSVIATLNRIASERREDAIQEAWLAHLEGRNPVRAMNAYKERERYQDAKCRKI